MHISKSAGPYVPRCGPCHRARGGNGLPSMAIPNRPDLDTQGGIVGICEGPSVHEHHGVVHVDHRGEPFDPASLMALQAKRAAWQEPVAGHTLIR